MSKCKYEFKIVSETSLSEEEMNEMGQKGYDEFLKGCKNEYMDVYEVEAEDKETAYLIGCGLAFKNDWCNEDVFYGIFESE